MTPELLADLRAVRPWLYGATALLYLAVALRMLEAGLVGRYPWFWVYVLLQGLAVAPWGLAFDREVMVPLVLRDPALWFLRGMAVLEALWRAKRSLRLLAAVAVIGEMTFVATGLLPGYGGQGNYFPTLAAYRLAVSLTLMAMAWVCWWLTRGTHGLLLACYVSLAACLALWDYQVFSREDGSLERAAWIYGGLAWFMPLRWVCLVGWWKIFQASNV